MPEGLQEWSGEKSPTLSFRKPGARRRVFRFLQVSHPRYTSAIDRLRRGDRCVEIGLAQFMLFGRVKE